MLLQLPELSKMNNLDNNSIIHIKSTDAIGNSKDPNSISDVQDLSYSDLNRSKKKEIKAPSFIDKNGVKKINLNPIYFCEDIVDSLNRMISLFLENHSNQDKVKEFRNLNSDKNGGYLLLQILEDFKEFSLFDLIHPSEFFLQDNEKKKKFLIERNNFFLRVLLNLDDKKLRVEDLVNKFVMMNTELIPDIEIDYFYLSLCEYKDQAETLEIKYNEYFRALLTNYSNEEAKRFYKKFVPQNYLSKEIQAKINLEISEVEINFIRSVLNSCVKRDFYEGILKIFDLDVYHFLFREIDFWENIILNIEAKKVYEIWKKFYEKFCKKGIKSINYHNIHDEKQVYLTLNENPKPKLLNSFKNSKIEKSEENFTLKNFTDLFTIIHNLLKRLEAEAYDKRIFNSPEIKIIKELAFYFLEIEGKCVKISQRIFEYCFDIDEDLCCAICHKVIDSDNVKEEYLMIAINKKYFRLTFPLTKFKQCKELLYTSNTQDLLLRYLRYGEYAYYALCLFSSINDKKLIVENSDKICKSILILLGDEYALSKCRHPIVTCVLGAEFLFRLGKLNIKYQYKCYSLAEMMVSIGQYLQEAIKEEDSLNYYLRTQTDDKGRSALEIIAENRFYQLLQDENVAAIVSKLWYGQGKTVDLFGFSMIYSIVSANIKHEQYKNLISKDTKEFKSKTFSFQFNQYIKNCSVRYLVDSVSTILTTILYQVIIYAYVLIMKSDQPEPEKNPVFYYSKVFADIVVFSINLNLFFYLVYVYKSSRKLNLTIFIILDVLLTIAVFFDIIGLPLNFFSDSNSIQLVNAIIYSFIIIFAWLRVTNILMTTRTFGPFLRIIYLILGTVFNFMIIFCCFNTISAQVFTLLFYKTNQDFSAFFTSWVSLFMAAFSLYNFSNFTDALYLGYGLLIIYVTISNLMLLNLIVSIISHEFEEFETLADSENRAVLVLTYERIKWDDKYGLLILLPAPFNLLNVVFIITLFLVPETKKSYYNKLFSQISYIVIALANFSVLLLISLIFFPLALIKSYIFSIKENWVNININMIPTAIFYGLRRPFDLLYYIIADVISFWKYCYVETEDINEVEKKLFKMPKESIKFLRNIFEIKYKQKKKKIAISEIYDIINQDKKNFIQNKTHIYSNGLKENLNASMNNLHSFNNNMNLLILDPKLRAELYISIKSLCDKLVDKDEFIDIERALLLLPQRIKYSGHFIGGIHSLNMKQILKGLRKYFYINSINNPIYSYRKLQQMIYKILIKFKLIIQMIPEQCSDTLVNNFNEENLKYERIKTASLNKNDEMNENEKDLNNYLSDEYHISNEDTNINKNSKKFYNLDASYDGSKAN